MAVVEEEVVVVMMPKLVTFQITQKIDVSSHILLLCSSVIGVQDTR